MHFFRVCRWDGPGKEAKEEIFLAVGAKRWYIVDRLAAPGVFLPPVMKKNHIHMQKKGLLNAPKPRYNAVEKQGHSKECDRRCWIFP